MPRIRHFVILLCLMPAAAWADTASIGVRGVFWHGQHYPADLRHVEMRLVSGDKSLATDATLQAFSQSILEPSFQLPAGDLLIFTLTENNTTLVKVEFHKQQSTYHITHPCKRRMDLYTIYPRSNFSSYIPPGTAILECKTPIGIIEIQFTCKADKPCWSAQPKP